MAADRLTDLFTLPTTLVADGALGTELQNRGLPAGAPPELWNEERPAAVLAVHEAYVQCGSDILLTNSFGASPWRLKQLGLASKARRLSMLAAKLCRNAAGELPVLGSIGPTGTLLQPWGEVSPAEAQEAFALQAEALAEGGVDGLLLETFFDLRELEFALAAVLEHSKLPVGCSMSFDSRGNTIMGASVEAFVDMVQSKGADRLLFLGANCSLGPEEMDAVCAKLCRASCKPVWVKPNAGSPNLCGDRTVYPASPAEFGRRARTWAMMGAKAVGGCCGTTPAHIRQIVEVLRET